MRNWLLMSILLQGKEVHIGDDEWGILESIDPDWLIEVRVPAEFWGDNTTKIFSAEDVCVENRGYLYSVQQLRELAE